MKAGDLVAMSAIPPVQGSLACLFAREQRSCFVMAKTPNGKCGSAAGSIHFSWTKKKCRWLVSKI